MVWWQEKAAGMGMDKRKGRGFSRSGVGLVVLGKERVGIAQLPRSPGSADTVDIILDGQGELDRDISTGRWSQDYQTGTDVPSH